MSLFSYWNGEMVENAKICISPDSRSFKYGEGCFETIKVVNGKIPLGGFHFQRLFSSLQTLKFFIPSSFTAENIQSEILNLVKVNKHEELARVRLVAYRGEAALNDLENKQVNYIIQSWAGKADSTHFNERGLTAGIFNDAKKNPDLFSSIKSNNYLGYAMGAIWSAENKLDDCFLTNAFGRIVEATIANVFIVSHNIIKTPALTEGCVNGVMRRYLLECFKKESLSHTEAKVSYEELINASEIFLTNAIYGLRWINRIEGKSYGNSVSSSLYQKFITPLFSPSTF